MEHVPNGRRPSSPLRERKFHLPYDYVDSYGVPPEIPLEEHLAKLAARYGVKPWAVREQVTLPTGMAPRGGELCDTYHCATCGKVLISAIKLGPRRHYCGACYTWPKSSPCDGSRPRRGT